MLKRAYELREVSPSSLGVSQITYMFISDYHPQVITAFICIADGVFGAILKLRHAGEKTKNIRWMAFHLSSGHWEQVRLGIEVLKVSAYPVMNPCTTHNN